jgi:1,4-alpha-glucan branching enzyme
VFDCVSAGFQWLVADDAEQSVFAWARYDGRGGVAVVISNFTPMPRQGYRVGLPGGHKAWRVALDSDHPAYGGSGYGCGDLRIEAHPCHGQLRSLQLNLPPLATIVLVPA